ncbi:MAG: hypothetical protein AAF802_13100, partial [Planctomycetota bacterium]
SFGNASTEVCREFRLAFVRGTPDKRDDHRHRSMSRYLETCYRRLSTIRRMLLMFASYSLKVKRY